MSGHLSLRDDEFNITIAYLFFLVLNSDAKHGPADSVTPVLIPEKPYSSNLFVFTQSISLYYPSFTTFAV